MNTKKILLTAPVLAFTLTGSACTLMGPPKMDNTQVSEEIATSIHNIKGVIEGTSIYSTEKQGLTKVPVVQVAITSAYNDKDKALDIAKQAHLAVDKVLAEKKLNTYEKSKLNVVVRGQNTDLTIYSDELGLPSKNPNFFQLNTWASQQK